jgi:hypothetical protein
VCELALDHDSASGASVAPDQASSSSFAERGIDGVPVKTWIVGDRALRRQSVAGSEEPSVNASSICAAIAR